MDSCVVPMMRAYFKQERRNDDIVSDVYYWNQMGYVKYTPFLFVLSKIVH